ncbi:MAG TPA: isocitrate lyase/phosphoenolpyruvate mutase family protein [Solirubrobacteraceae bacterium]|nr:isocitrate lyase/phosphoenolpyruvate mutase family protein [Solirubrobacteraceae bacterium]
MTHIADHGVSDDVYGLAPAEFVDGLLGAGAVGANLEDTDPATRSLRDMAEQAGYLAAVKDAPASAASTSSSTRASTSTCAAAPSTTASRALAPIARRGPTASIRSSATTRRASRRVQAAAVVNVHVHPSAPDLARLAELGVARASLGGSLFRAAMAAASSYAP